MPKATDSYEMIRWIPFDRKTPVADQELIVFSELLGTLLAVMTTTGLEVYDHQGAQVSGSFTHWAKPIKGPSTTQLWMDWAISWVK